MFVDAIDRDAAETIVDHLRASNAPMRVAQLRVLGGAMARVPVAATAFAHRRSRIMANLATFYDGPADRAVRQAWVSDFAAALGQEVTGAYVNFLGDDGQARLRQAYRPDLGSSSRGQSSLRPNNLFRLNQNIPPPTRGRIVRPDEADPRPSWPVPRRRRAAWWRPDTGSAGRVSRLRASIGHLADVASEPWGDTSTNRCCRGPSAMND